MLLHRNTDELLPFIVTHLNQFKLPGQIVTQQLRCFLGHLQYCLRQFGTQVMKKTRKVLKPRFVLSKICAFISHRRLLHFYSMKLAGINFSPFGRLKRDFAHELNNDLYVIPVEIQEGRLFICVKEHPFACMYMSQRCIDLFTP